MSPTINPINPNDEAYKFVSERVRPLFEKVAQEALKNRMSVGGSVGSSIPHCIYHPHNYRLYFDFNKEKLFQKPTPDRSVVTPFKIRNSTEMVLEGFLGCNLIIKKNFIEIRNFIDHERKYRIPISTEAHEKFIQVERDKINQSEDILKEFIKKYGGESTLTLKRLWHESKIWQEASIDKIPLEARWHGQVSKKLYNEPNVEFNDAIHACNYIETRAIENIAPKVAHELNNIKSDMKMMSENMVKMSESNKYLAENWNAHIPAIIKLGDNAEKLGENSDKLASNVEKLTEKIKTEKKYKHPNEIMSMPNWVWRFRYE